MLSSAHLRVNYEGDSAHSHNWVRHGGQAFGCGLLACFRVWALREICTSPNHLPCVSLFQQSNDLGGSHTVTSALGHIRVIWCIQKMMCAGRARAGLAERVGCMQRRVAADSQQQPFVKARKR